MDPGEMGVNCAPTMITPPQMADHFAATYPPSANETICVMGSVNRWTTILTRYIWM